MPARGDAPACEGTPPRRAPGKAIAAGLPIMAGRNDPNAWMWAAACDRVERAGGLHRRFFRLASQLHGRATWEPPVDVFEDESEFLVVAAMPGVAAEHVQVAIEGSQLLLRGLRAGPLVLGSHVLRQLEIPFGSFERRIPLPAGRLEVGLPELVRGCLIVRLHKPGRSPA